MARKAFYIPYPRFILLDKTRIWLGMARKAFYIPYPRFTLLNKTRIWLGMARKAFSIPYARFILLDKTRIWLGMARKAFYIPYLRFILFDKTRIWLGLTRNAFYIPYPRFILLDKTRIWLGKHVSQEFMISVRPSVRPSATHPSVSTFYPNPDYMLVYLGYIKLHLTFITMFGSRWVDCCNVLYVWHLRNYIAPRYFICTSYPINSYQSSEYYRAYFNIKKLYIYIAVKSDFLLRRCITRFIGHKLAVRLQTCSL